MHELSMSIYIVTNAQKSPEQPAFGKRNLKHRHYHPTKTH